MVTSQLVVLLWLVVVWMLKTWAESNEIARGGSEPGGLVAACTTQEGIGLLDQFHKVLHEDQEGQLNKGTAVRRLELEFYLHQGKGGKAFPFWSWKAWSHFKRAIRFFFAREECDQKNIEVGSPLCMMFSAISSI